MNVNSEVLVEAPGEHAEASQPIRIWHVDDHDHVRRAIAEFVGQIAPKFRFEREFSSPEGLLEALISGNPPDVILLDIQMGQYNGLDSIRPVKMLVPEVRVLMLTTFAAPEAIARAKHEGASDFLQKCWPAEQLRNRIRDAMLREPAQPSELVASTRAADNAGNPRSYGGPSNTWVLGAGWMRSLVFLRTLLGLGLTKPAEH